MAVIAVLCALVGLLALLILGAFVVEGPLPVFFETVLLALCGAVCIGTGLHALFGLAEAVRKTTGSVGLGRDFGRGAGVLVLASLPCGAETAGKAVSVVGGRFVAASLSRCLPPRLQRGAPLGRAGVGELRPAGSEDLDMIDTGAVILDPRGGAVGGCGGGAAACRGGDHRGTEMIDRHDRWGLLRGVQRGVQLPFAHTNALAFVWALRVDGLAQSAQDCNR